jgi:hypothetical protein
LIEIYIYTKFIKKYKNILSLFLIYIKAKHLIASHFGFPYVFNASISFLWKIRFSSRFFLAAVCIRLCWRLNEAISIHGWRLLLMFILYTYYIYLVVFISPPGCRDLTCRYRPGKGDDNISWGEHEHYIPIYDNNYTDW